MSKSAVPSETFESPPKAPTERSSRSPEESAKTATNGGGGSPFSSARNDPRNEDNWDAVDEAARSADSPDAAELLYQEVLASNLDSEGLAIVGRRAIEFLEEWYEDTGKSIDILLGLVRKDYQNSWALEKLSLLLTLAERWDDLLGIYDEALNKLTEKAAKIHLLEEAARIAKDFAGEAQRASDYLKQLLLVRPEDAKLAGSLERRLEQQERHQDLVDIWTARLQVVDEEAELHLRERIGLTLLDNLGDAHRAIEAAKQLLERGIGEGQACALLERITDAGNAEVDTRREALDILRDRYGKADRPREVIRVLIRALDLAPDDEARVTINQGLVRWLLEVDEVSQAQQACARWLRLRPGSEEALPQLRTLARKTKEYGAFAEALVNAAEVAANAALRMDLLLEAATAQEENAGDHQAATDLFARVLLDGESDQDSKLRAARQLAGLLTSPAQAGQRLDVLEKLSALEAEPDTRVELLGEGAELAEKLGDDDRALRLWNQRLELRPGDKISLDAKVGILDRCERFKPLQETLLTRFEESKNEEQRRADLVWIARIDEERLDAVGDAIESWRRVEDNFGANAETVDSLTRLLTRAGRWDELVRLLMQAIGSEESIARRTRHLTTVGDVLRREKQEPERAVEQYKNALELDPSFEEARSGLTELLGDPRAGHAAVETLASAYRAADEWENLLAIAEQRLDLEPEPGRRQQVLLETSQLLEERAKEPGRALGYVERAFSIRPDGEVESQMLRLAQETTEWNQAVNGYQRALRHCDDLGRTTELLYEQGRLLEKELSEFQEGLFAYRRIVELVPQHTDSACAVIRCAAEVGTWDHAAWSLLKSASALGDLDPAVVQTLETAATKADAWSTALERIHNALKGGTTEDGTSLSLEMLKPEVSHNVKFQLARWHRDRQNDAKTAEATLLEAVDEHRTVESLEMLCDLQRQHPDRALVQSLLKLADVAEDALPCLNEASHVALDVVQDPALATPILHRSLELADLRIAEAPDPKTVGIAHWSLEQLVSLYRAANQAETAFELLGQGTKMNFAPEVVLDLKHAAALVAWQELQDADRASAICRSVLEVEPGREDTINLLANVYEQRGQLVELHDLREHELKLKPALPRRLELRLELARVMGELGESALARQQQLLANLGEEPGHAESIDALDAIMSPAGQHMKLYELLCEQANAVREEGQDDYAAQLYARGGRLAEHTVGDVEAAISAYEHSVALAPGVDVLDALADIHTARGEHERAVKWLTQRLELTPTTEVDAHRVALVRLGTALREAGQADLAIATLTDGLSGDAAAQGVRELLAALHETRGEWQDFATLLAEGVTYADSEKTKVEYLSRSADVRWHQLNDLESAIPLLRKALLLDPQNRELRTTLADALRLGGQYDEAKELLDGLLLEFGRRRTPERAHIHFLLAQIARATGQLEEALEQLDSASKIQRSEPIILKTLGDVAREKGELERAERAYRALLLLVGRNSDQEIGASTILFELYRIAIERDDQERAQDLLDSAIEATDQNVEEARRLEQALIQAGQWKLLLGALERREPNTKEASELRALRKLKAEALVNLERPEQALEIRLQLLSELPIDEKLLNQTAELAARCDKLPAFQTKVTELADAYLSVDPALSCDLWLSLGKSCEQRGDKTEAVTLYEKAQATGSKPLETFQALSACLDPQRDERALEQAIAVFLQTPEEDQEGIEAEVTEARFTLAELQLCRKRGREDGLSQLTKALRASANRERTVRILERSIETVGPHSSVLNTLETIARAAQDDALLLRALSISTKLADTSLEQLKEAVELADQLDQHEQANQLLERTVEFADRNKLLSDVVWALTRLSKVRLDQGQEQAGVTLLECAIENSSAEERTELQLALAQLYKERVGNPGRAAIIYQELAEKAPGDPRIWKPLIEIYRHTAQQEALETALSRAEEHVVEDEQRLELKLERIRLVIDAERFDEAEQALKATLEESPGSQSAGDLLLELLERQERTDDVRYLLQERLDYAISANNEKLIVHQAQRLGSLYEKQGENRAALDVYHSARSAVKTSRELIGAILKLMPEEDSEERADLMESLLPTESRENVEGVSLALAALRRGLDDQTGVERALELGFKLNPHSEELRSRLENWYREREDWLPLAELITFDADSQESTEESVKRFTEAAQLYEERLGDAATAAEVLGKALDRSPTASDVLELYSQYQLTVGGGEHAIHRITVALDSDDLQSLERPLLHHLRAAVRARADEQSLDAIAAAVADLDMAAKLGSAEVDEDLGALLLRQQELAARDGNKEAEAVAVQRLSEFLPAHDRAGEALAVLARWLEKNEDDLDAARKLGALALELSDWQAARKAYRRLYALTSGDERRLAAIRYAEACEHSGAPMEAKDVLDEIRAEFPRDKEIAQRLFRMYDAAGAQSELATTLLQEAEETDDAEQRYALLISAGRLLNKAEQANPQAVDAFRRALEIKPKDHEATMGLAQAYTRAEQIAEACSILESAIKRQGKRRSTMLSELQHAMADVARSAGDEEGRLAWLDAALQSDRKNGAVASELAIFAMDRGEYDSAVKALQLITLLKEECPMTKAEAYLRQGLIAQERGDSKKALLLGKRAISADPDYEAARQFLDQLG